MEFCFLLEHIYELNDIEEVKFIGVFSKEENARRAISMLRTKNGFVNYPEDCFKVHIIKFDEYEWKEGFISWNEAF